MGAEPSGHDDPRAADAAGPGHLSRLLLAVLRVVLYPLLALRRWRAAPAAGWVELEIDGRVPELPAPRSLLGRLRRKPGLSLLEIRSLVAEIALDPRPRGLLVTVREFEGGMATALSLRDALLAASKSGRRVAVHLPAGADTKAYLVASAAGHLSAFPGASLALLGFASRGVYFREALARTGVVAEVLARGRYKSAGESLTRDAMSEPQREQVGAVLDRMHAALVAALREGRGLGLEQATAAIDRGVFRAPEAVEAKLLDAALFDDEVGKALCPGVTPAPASVAAPAYLRARRATRLGAARGGPCIGVVRVHGAIVQGGSPFARGATEPEVVGAIRAAREDRRVRGVVLHIDSPGGSALASARMHRELELCAAEKPLVAAMANVAASGGYYVAAPAHAIVAQPVTITGSIGVISARLALGPVLDRLGVHVESLKRGERADLFDSIHPLRPEERAALEHEIEGTYGEFIAVVARGRKKTADEVEGLAQGRVWTGEDAHARGLVDLLGGFDVALAEVRRRVGTGGDRLPPRVVRGGKEPVATLSARAPDTTSSALDALLGEWSEIVPLLTTRERVLAWSPALMGFRRG